MTSVDVSNKLQNAHGNIVNKKKRKGWKTAIAVALFIGSAKNKKKAAATSKADQKPDDDKETSKGINNVESGLDFQLIKNSFAIPCHLKDLICTTLQDQLLTAADLWYRLSDSEIKSLFPLRGVQLAIAEWKNAAWQFWKFTELPKLTKKVFEALNEINVTSAIELLLSPAIPPQGRKLLMDQRDNNGDNVLAKAIKSGSFELVQFMVNYLEADIDARGRGDETAWLTACSQGQQAIADLLAKKGADVEATDANGCKAIHLASQFGNVKTVEYLLRLKPQWTNVRSSKWGLSPLLYAAWSNNVSVVKHLSNRSDVDVDAEDNNNCKAIHIASQFGGISLVDHFLNLNPSWLETPNKKWGRTPLLHAASSGNLSVLKFLVEQKKANVDVEDGLGCKAIHVAARDGNAITVEYLLGVKANWLEAKSSRLGCTPFLHAARGGNCAVLRFLTSNKAFVHAEDSDSCQAIHLASQFGNVEAVEFLLGLNADWLETPNKDWGRTPLLHAACGGNLSVIKFLLAKRKANVEAVDSDMGDSALHLSAYYGHDKVVAYLVQHWPQLAKKRNRAGEMAVAIATDKNVVDILKRFA